jgi:ubiquinone/menaquinone biosynthesis C-methylase UbiE
MVTFNKVMSSKESKEINEFKGSVKNNACKEGVIITIGISQTSQTSHRGESDSPSLTRNDPPSPITPGLFFPPQTSQNTQAISSVPSPQLNKELKCSHPKSKIPLNPRYENRKITLIWRDKFLRKLFLDILGNSQFRMCKYVKKDFFKKMSNLINRKKLKDDKVYNYMFDWVHKDIRPSVRDMILRDNNKYRSTNRAEKIKELVKRYLRTDTKRKGAKLNMLDLGCAEGSITVMVGKYMDINREQLHGCDVEDLKSDNPYQDNFTFTHLYNEKSSYSLPYKDGSCDVTLALMSLHHIPNKCSMLKEIRRILKPGGLFIIREHDCVSNGLALVLDVIHGFYSMVWSNPREMENFDDYYAEYTSSNQLTYLIEREGFNEVYNNRLPDFPRFYRGKVINPLNYYYGVYRRDSTNNKK